MPTRHPEYYLSDGNIVFLVEEQLYRVHRFFFMSSPVFQTMVTLPTVPNQPTEGDSDDNPIDLAQVKGQDFDCLLWFFYRSQYPNSTPRNLPLSEAWGSILRVAHMWEFDPIRDVAVKHLETLDLKPIDRVCIAEQFDLGVAWAIDAYWDLCTRPKALAVSEARSLTLESVVRIAQIREYFRGPSRVNGSGSHGTSSHLKQAMVEMLEGKDVGDSAEFEDALWSSPADRAMWTYRRGGTGIPYVGMGQAGM